MRVAHKLTATLVVGILLVHGTNAALTIHRETRQLRDDIERDERALGRALALSVSRIWHAFGEDEALRLVDEATEQHRVEVRWVWLDAPAGDAHAAVAAPDILAPIVRGEVVVVELATDRDAVYTYAPVSVPGDRLGAIEISDVLDDEAAYLRDSMLAAALTALALVVCCGVLAWMTGTLFIGRPVGRLVSYARTIEAGDLTKRPESLSSDELGELGAALGKMSAGLQQARERTEAEARARLAAVEQLRHAERLASVGTLAAGVAHELGTPINVIDGHAQLIREDRGASESIVENTAVIARQCKRMTAIIRDLLRFARRGAPSGGTVDVAEVTRETMRMCEVLIRNRAVTTTLDDSGELVAEIGLDPMQQILTNVFMNAIQAMPDGGSLSVKLSREHATAPGASDGAEYARIRVTDSGIGMSRETRQRIFEPFFTTKDVGEGTGLGLSVALGIANDHRGWIEAESEPDRGSTVSIYIPARAATPT